MDITSEDFSEGLFIIATRGLPASGKSTWAKQFAGLDSGRVVRINNDEIREMLFGPSRGHNFPKQSSKVVRSVRENMIKSVLKLGGDRVIIVDNTHCRKSELNRLALLAKMYGATLIVHDFDTDIDTCKVRNNQRDDVVPEEVIDSMANALKNSRNEYLEPVSLDVEPYVRPDGLPLLAIVDLDGTIAIPNGRSPYSSEGVERDLVSSHVFITINTLMNDQLLNAIGLKFMFLSGRKEAARAGTLAWLQTVFGRDFSDMLFMRADDDNRSDIEVKLDLFNQHIRGKYNVAFAFDDRDQVVHLWRNLLGIPTFQVANGDF